MAREDLTTFAETDVAGDRLQNISARHVEVVDVDRDEDVRLQLDLGSALADPTAADPWRCIVTLDGSTGQAFVHHMWAADAAGCPGIGGVREVLSIRSRVDQPRIQAYRQTGGSGANDATPNLTYDTPYYCIAYRHSSTTWRVVVRTGSFSGSITDTLDVTGGPSAALRHLGVAGGNMDGAGGTAGSATIDDVDFGFTVALPATDDFDRSDRSLDEDETPSGHTWSTWVGHGNQIESNRFGDVSNGFDGSYIRDMPDTADVEVQGTAKFTITFTNSMLLARVDAAGNGYGFGWDNTNGFSIWKWTAGSRSIIASAAGSVVDGDALKFVAAADALTGYVNGLQVVTTTDADYATGKAGIYIGNGNGQWDDFSVAEPSAPPSASPNRRHMIAAQAA